MTTRPPRIPVIRPPTHGVVEPDVRMVPWQAPLAGSQRTETVKIEAVPLHLLARIQALQVLAPRVTNRKGSLVRRTWKSIFVEALEYGILTLEKKYGSAR